MAAAAPESEGKWGAAMQAFIDEAAKQWECPVCLVRNDPEDAACPCGAPRPASAGGGPSSSSSSTSAAAASAGNAFASDPFGRGSAAAFAPAPAAGAGANPFAAAAGASAFGAFAANPFEAAAAAPVAGNPFGAVSGNPFGPADSGEAPDPMAWFNDKAKATIEEDAGVAAAEAVAGSRWHAPVALVKRGSKAKARGAARADGAVWLWGSGECEQLGDIGDEAVKDGVAMVPTPVPSLSGRAVVQVAAGSLHTLARLADGSVWSWGCNDDKVLGRPGPEGVPAPVPGFGPGGAVAAHIASGDAHAAALDDTGGVWVWGTYKGKEGRLGFSAGVDRAELPVELRDTRKHGRVVRLTCGADHTAAVTEGGRLLTWGSGEVGQLGFPVTHVRMRGNRQKTLTLRVTPVRVSAREEDESGRVRKGAVEVEAAFAAGYGLWVVTRRGTVLASGLNCYGQLGLGDLDDRHSLEEVPALSGRGVVQVVSGSHHVLVVTSSGRLYGLGRGDSGQLGLSDASGGVPPLNAATFEARRIVRGGLGDRTVVMASANANASAAVCSDGSVFVWGFGSAGQTGQDSFDDVVEPMAVRGGAIAGRRVAQVSLGSQHCAAIPASKDDAGAAARAAPAAAAAAAEPRSGHTPAAKRARPTRDE